MKKREFLIQYVLNRALTNRHSLDGEYAMKEALKAWKLMEKEL